MRLTRDKARRAMGGLTNRRLTSPSIIRVVKIKSSTPEWPIRVKLKTIDCRTTKYTALSYAHDPDLPENQRYESSEGSPGVSRPRAPTHRSILCDGKPIMVTEALWDALDQLRRLGTDVPVWVDKLCINFESREERAAQVNMMSYVYANASHIIVWLGKNTKSTGDTLLCMRKLVNAINWRRIPHNFAMDFRDPVTYTRLGMDRISLHQWNNIYIFCHARWFSRLWPFYELASAKQAMFLIGNAFMDYDFLMDFAMVLGLTGWLETLSEMAVGGYHEDFVGLTKMLGPVATLRSIPIWHPQHHDHVRWMKSEHGLNTEVERAWKFFELLLQGCERFECHDPRDRIFAPLAYVKKVFAGQPINKTWPIVDYGTSVEMVYTHFASMIQRHTHEPSILTSFGYQQKKSPSNQPVVTRGRPERRAILD